MLILEVLIEYGTASLNRPFSYAYLGDLSIFKGVRVLVPFANKRIIGFVNRVYKVSENLEEYKRKVGFEVKEIISVIDEKPLFNDELLVM